MSIERPQIHFNLQVDCEATQSSVQDPNLGERAVRGIVDVLNLNGMKGTFVVIPTDLEVHAQMYQDVLSMGHEVGLHLHPSEMGYQEFLGLYGFDEQVEILSRGKKSFEDAMGYAPLTFTPGYFSANDHTFPALESQGFTHGSVGLPTRDLPHCACVWGNAPLDAHYPHRYNKSLSGDVDFVEIPVTIDKDSRMWGGGHPQDLRVELLDSKNHFYTIKKAIDRQLAAGGEIPIKVVKALTHNIFDYSDEKNFRRETLVGIIDAVKTLCEKTESQLVAATTGDIAAAYRQVAPPPGDLKLSLDTQGRKFAKS